MADDRRRADLVAEWRGGDTTPPPYDTASTAFAWERNREKVYDLSVTVAGMRVSIDSLIRRIDHLETKTGDMSGTLDALKTSAAVQTKMLEHLVDSRKEDSSRTRAVFAVVIPLLSIAVAIIAIATR